MTFPMYQHQTDLDGSMWLMYDVSGEGRARHLNGTAKLLLYFGPEAYLVGAGRRLFPIIRIFEIPRALLFTNKTFLAEKEWQGPMAQMWMFLELENWHPNERLFDVMILCSFPQVRGWKVTQGLANLSKQELDMTYRLSRMKI